MIGQISNKLVIMVETISQNVTQNNVQSKNLICHELFEYLSASKGMRKFGGKGAAREKAETNSRMRRAKLVSSVRSNIIRRRLVNRNRDAVRRAKLMRRYFICFSLSSIQSGAVFLFCFLNIRLIHQSPISPSKNKHKKYNYHLRHEIMGIRNYCIECTFE